MRYLVDGVTKLEKVDYGAAAEPETFRKMLVATGNDVRVMSIKLADRLHNMRTLGVMRPAKQERIAKVTRDVLIPLAERLGVQALKTELEDLVFAILHPEEYEKTRELIVRNAARADDPLADVADDVREVLREADIPADVLIRPRHFVSVHRVSRKRGPLRGADFGRLLVLVNEDADCYAVLGELHTCMTPVVSEFKDFIAVPKFNLYQSLHTAVTGDDGQVVEVLIRTHQMHKVAEAGVVALGNPYAAPPEEQSAGDGERVDPTRPGWLSRLLEWQRAAPDPDTFWSTLREDLAQDREITVFRPDGGTLGLPEGATCVDAAYAQYGEDAHSCIGARVNGRLATLSTVLRDGDTVQLLMDQDAASAPSREWLDHATTPAARIAIQRWLAAHPTAEDSAPRRTPAPCRTPPAVRRRVHGPRTSRRRAGTGRPGRRDRTAGPAAARPYRPTRSPASRCAGNGDRAPDGVPAVARMKSAGRTEVGVRWGEGAECRVTLVAESFVRPHLLADLTEAMATEGAEIVSATVEPRTASRSATPTPCNSRTPPNSPP